MYRSGGCKIKATEGGGGVKGNLRAEFASRGSVPCLYVSSVGFVGLVVAKPR